MAAPKTVITFDLDGSNKDFEVPFEYLARKFVVLTLIGTDRKELVLNVDYRFTQRTVVTTTQAWGPSAGYTLLEIKRVTSATERLVDFSDGSVLRASDLNTATVQALHISEEGRDIATDTIGVDNDGNLDARGRKMVNLADAIEDGDAVSLGLLKGMDTSAWNAARESAASAIASKASAALSERFAAEANLSATSASGSAARSEAAAEEANRFNLRGVRAPATDPILNPMPPVAERAGKLISFDYQGHPVSVAAPDGTALELELALSLPTGSKKVGYKNTNLGDFLDTRWIGTLAGLLELPSGITGAIQVLEAGVGGFFKVDPTVTVANGITTFISSGGIPLRRLYDGAINIRWAGAKCDKVTDDTAAVQRVVDYCSTFTDWPAIDVPGPTLIKGTIMVDREVIAHTDRAEWIVNGIGGDGGFHRVDANQPMFSSRLPMVNQPLSAWITWRNVRFTSPNRALGVTVLSKNFLQQKFIGCWFLRVRLGTTDKYWQSMFFDHCNFRYTSGVFLHSSNSGYDVHYVGCVSEYGESYLNYFAQNLYSFSFTGGLHEGAFGGVLAGGGCNGLFIAGNYFEHNQAPAVDISVGGTNHGVVISGNFFATDAGKLSPTFFEIVWGSTTGAVSHGNFCENGRLHDNSAMGISGLDSVGDFAAIALFRSPLLVSRFETSWAPVASGPATVVQALARRSGNIMHVDFVITFPSSTSSTPATISGLPLPSKAVIFGGVVGYADLAGDVRIIGGSAIPNATANSFHIAKNLQGLRYTLAELSGVQIAGSITYNL